jgi:hypothetical protein
VTGPQRETLAAIYEADKRGQWFRARGKGERVTLVHLYRKGILDRRVWRKAKDSQNDAHEYRLHHSQRVHFPPGAE